MRTRKDIEKLEDEIWKKNALTEEIFKENHKYYLQNMEDYEAIYKSLIDSFGVMELKKESVRNNRPKGNKVLNKNKKKK